MRRRKVRRSAQIVTLNAPALGGSRVVGRGADERCLFDAACSESVGMRALADVLSSLTLVDRGLFGGDETTTPTATTATPPH